jgi:hypothetical protein
LLTAAANISRFNIIVCDPASPILQYHLGLVNALTYSLPPRSYPKQVTLLRSSSAGLCWGQ